ncbi:MAG: phospholipase effector Tle1 domain-containing protein [Kiritimatiellia bacterium]
MRRRNIAVFFDGTGQDRKQLLQEKWSNVVLVHDAMSVEEGSDVVQVRKYIDGVGTRSGEDMSGGGLGIGLDERVEEAYEYLWEEVNNAIEDGEEPHLYLFGFSRGAFAARWLASLIKFSGIPKDKAPRRKMFKNHREQDSNGAKRIREKGLAWDDVPINFIGLWDTVEASVNPSYDIADVPSQVVSVYHALAIDEWRYTFNPTRFTPSDKVREVWFPGGHTDVGGGYAKRGLANASLWWMVAGVQEAGLRVDKAFLQRAVDVRSSDIKYHDELFEGEKSKLWKGLNLAAGYTGRFLRTIGENDLLHPAVQRFAYAAPTERPFIPTSCVVVDDKDNHLLREMVSIGRT